MKCLIPLHHRLFSTLAIHFNTNFFWNCQILRRKAEIVYVTRNWNLKILSHFFKIFINVYPQIAMDILFRKASYSQSHTTAKLEYTS